MKVKVIIGWEGASFYDENDLFLEILRRPELRDFTITEREAEAFAIAKDWELKSYGYTV